MGRSNPTLSATSVSSRVQLVRPNLDVSTEFEPTNINSASRAALAALSNMMSMELEPHGIHVVEPDFGVIDTAASHEVRQLEGAERWLRNPAGIGSLEEAAEAVVNAADSRKSGFVFFPRALKWIDRFPALGRRFSRRVSKYADLNGSAIRSGGSQGDAVTRAIRAEWENKHAVPFRSPGR